MVERFMREHFEMRPYAEGMWVRHSDYAALEADNLRLQNEWDNSDEMLQACRSRIAALEVQLAETERSADHWLGEARRLLKAGQNAAYSLEATPPAPKVTDADLKQDVIDLVIAAREFWDDHNDLSEESGALDKALVPFADRVPYDNEPEALTAAQEAGKL